MSILFYSLLLIFFIIPVTVRAYLSLKSGRFPLPYFQNNVVVNRVKLRRSIGVLSPIIFWAFHVLYVLGALATNAWLAALAAVFYMVISSLLSSQIRAKQIGVLPESAIPVEPPSKES